MRFAPCALPGLLVALLGLIAAPPRDARAGAATVRIGMVQTFFHDVPRPLIQLATEPLGALMRETTGLTGALVVGSDAFTVAQQLQDGKLQLGVFHSFEYAWVRAKYPELRPLMVAINSQRSVQAFVLVRKDCEAASFADLKGKDFAIPKRTREHCRLYLERYCHDDGACASKQFFGRIVTPLNVETALDQLCRGAFTAAIVDSIGLEFYKELKPGCFARLKVLARSEAFPPPVIAYRQGGIDETMLGQVRDGLQSAHKTDLGREMMKMWKITSFDPVPETYAASLAECLRAYPGPEAK